MMELETTTGERETIMGPILLMLARQILLAAVFLGAAILLAAGLLRFR